MLNLQFNLVSNWEKIIDANGNDHFVGGE